MTMHIVSFTDRYTPDVVRTQIMRGQPDRDTAVMRFQEQRLFTTIVGCEAVDATPLSKAQKAALVAARDWGSANHYGYTRSDGAVIPMSHPFRVSRSTMFLRMRREGLLGQNLVITPAGLAVLGAK